MNNTLIDNSSDVLSMINTLRSCIAIPEIKTIRIATGYWDIPGLSLITKELELFLQRDETYIEILLGKDPYIYASQIKEPKYKDAKYPLDYIRTDINELGVVDEFKPSIKLLLKYCTDEDNSKIQIRVFRKNENEEIQFLHSKCYIFDGKSRGFGCGIIGSSNFTQKGLEGNAELNYLETDVNKVLSLDPIPNHKTHIQWFEEKWIISEPWNKQFLEQVLKSASITKKIEEEETKQPFTPYELYIKLLQIKFGDILDKNLGQQIESYLPSKIQKLEYQIEAVKRCIGIMREHGGFILADVVGLGKTIIGALIIKRFLSVPEDDGRERKVLVITPPAIQSAWKKTITLFERETEEKISPYIDFITTGRIGNVDDLQEEVGDEVDTGEFAGSLQEKNYGFIIIDESHKFRNNNTLMYQTLDELIQNIGSNTGVFPYVGLLSATPQNNRPNDIKNQLYLFERNHTDSTLKKAESGNIEKFFASISREYDQLIDRKNSISDAERKKRLDLISKKLRDNILSDILERRTRTDVIKYYENDIKLQGLIFPEIKGPLNLKYIMDDELAKLFADTMLIIAPTDEEKLRTDNYLKYYRYRAIEYFKIKDNEYKYIGRGNRGVKDISKQLSTIMQMLLVKRLESSFSAFTQSLLNLRRYTENMIKMWENNTIFVCPQIDINKELDCDAKTERRKRKVTFDDCVNDIRDKIIKMTEQGRNDKCQNAEYKQSDFNDEYYSQLKDDYKLISKLYDRWARNSEDPKYDTFKESIKSKLFDPKKNTAGKLVIFSEAIDTVYTLERAVKAKGYKPLVITAANRDEMENVIEENFDANYEGEWKNEYNVIITTEVLAEGINLHRANVILNYDTPWNATRLMQRIGRVNRFGSKEPCVYVYNFMPSAQGDKQIQLVRKAYTKLQSFHVLFGEDSKIFSNEENVVHYDIAKAVDGEESPLQKYVFELKQYKESHPERYLEIEKAEDNWQIAQAESGTSFFIVKAPKSARLTIRIKQENDEYKSQVISLLEMLEDMKVDENVRAVPLPKNWNELLSNAIRTYNQYFVRINKSKTGDKRTQALKIIVDLYNNQNLSRRSKDLLKGARKLVDKGSYDIIKKMIAIEKELYNERMNLFTLEQQDIDNVLEQEIGKIVTNVETKQGEASVILGTIK